MDLRERREATHAEARRPGSPLVKRAAAALVLGAIVASWAYVGNYVPFVGGFVGPATTCLERGPSVRDVEVLIATCTQEGSVLEWGFSWMNDGPLGVHILETQWMGESGVHPLVPIELRSYDLGLHVGTSDDPPSALPATFDDMDAFPASMAAGEGRVFVFRATHVGCAQSFATFESIWIKYRVLGFTREERVPLPSMVLPCPPAGLVPAPNSRG